MDERMIVDHAAPISILLVYGGLNLGGIETYLRDLAAEFAEMGHNVTVLTTHGGDDALRSAISRSADVISLPPGAYARPYAHSRHAMKNLSFEVTICLNLQALWFVGCQRNVHFGKILTAFYHPREGVTRRPEWLGWRAAAIREVRGAPAENMIFANAPTRAAHEATWGRELRGASLIPAGVRLNQTMSRLPETARRGRLVSVGRLVDFKTYNEAMIRIAERLSKAGHGITYDIFGDGEDSARLQQIATDEARTAQVKLHGPIPYHELQKSIGSAWVFIGMGRALIEACAMGIPSIVARMDATDGTCYGFFHNFEGDNTSEPEEGKPLFSLEDCVREALMMTGDEYKAACLLTRRKAISLFDLRQGAERILQAAMAATDWEPRFSYADYVRDGLRSVQRAAFPKTRQQAWNLWSEVSGDSSTDARRA